MKELRQLTPQECVLVYGLIDIMPEGIFGNEAVDAGLVKAPDIRAFSIGLMHELLLDGLIVAGPMKSDASIEPWQIAPSAAIARITREWVEIWPEGSPVFGEIACFGNTPAGVTHAKEVEHLMYRPPKLDEDEAQKEKPADKGHRYVMTRARKHVIAFGDFEKAARLAGLKDPVDQRIYARGLACEFLVMGELELVERADGELKPTGSVAEAIERLHEYLKELPSPSPRGRLAARTSTLVFRLPPPKTSP
ncbi:MAG TPA: hypothetical protein VK139_03815 [Microbacteriaceae bacterium]|nr:hypothetical protein [Microbacteriaceae bacterium]